MPDRTVVVTGLGAVTSLGNDLASTWAGLVAGHRAQFAPCGEACPTMADQSHLLGGRRQGVEVRFGQRAPDRLMPGQVDGPSRPGMRKQQRTGCEQLIRPRGGRCAGDGNAWQ